MDNKLTWHWVDECRVCDYCEWFVLAEKYSYYCIGCERSVDKPDIEEWANDYLW